MREMASKTSRTKKSTRQDLDENTQLGEATSVEEGAEGEGGINTAELLRWFVQQQQSEADRREKDQIRREEEAERVRQREREDQRREREHQLELAQVNQKLREQEIKLQEVRHREQVQQLTETMQTLAMAHAKPPIRPPKLRTLAGGAQVDEELTRFEKHMATLGVPQREWVSHLEPLLQGEALTAYLAVPADLIADYNAVKDAICQRMGISVASYQKRWWDAKPEGTESATQLAARMTDLAGKAAKNCTTTAEVLDMFTREHFFRVIPAHIAQWVRGKEPKTTREAATLTDNYIRDRNLDHWEGSSHRGIQRDALTYPSRRRVRTLTMVLRSLQPLEVVATETTTQEAGWSAISMTRKDPSVSTAGTGATLQQTAPRKSIELPRLGRTTATFWMGQ